MILIKIAPMVIIKVTVAGWSENASFQKAANVVASLEHMFPNQIKAEIIEHKTREAYNTWLPKIRERLKGGANSNFQACPITWIDDVKLLGGIDDFMDFARSVGKGGPQEDLRSVIEPDTSLAGDDSYEYDLVVIGGGSGGLAAAKEAAKLGAKVVLLDFVKPSPQGSTWGLGGTCVNVGCIPKKLFHHAALNGESMHDSSYYGWNVEVKGHDWDALIANVRDYIQSLNFGYRVQLREKNVKYINSLGSVVDAHTVQTVDKKGKVGTLTTKQILVAVGGRPNPLDCEGGELAITSDDMFFLSKAPGKTLVVGASYVALECASFLSGFGYDTTVMVRSILLRGFDQQMADLVGGAMEKNIGTKFIRGVVPTKLEKTSDDRIHVYWDGGDDIFDTVLAAVGRHADTKGLGLDKVGVELDRAGKVIATHCQTSVPSIFAIGDCVRGNLELTPVAIELGRNLAGRLYGDVKKAVDMRSIPTAIFAGLEYACVGIPEEKAREELGDENVEVYHTHFTPLQWTIAKKREFNQCYVKVIVDTQNDEKVVGIHIMSPEASEIIQPYGIAMKLGMTYQDLNELIGIHPTIGEEVCMLTIAKSSGAEAVKSGC